MKDLFPIVSRNKLDGRMEMSALEERHGISDSIRTASPWRQQKSSFIKLCQFYYCLCVLIMYAFFACTRGGLLTRSSVVATASFVQKMEVCDAMIITANLY